MLIEKSTLFPRTFFDVIPIVKKSTLFPRTFLDVISLVEKSRFFPRTFFDVTSLVENFTLLPLAFFDVNLMVKKSTLFVRNFFDEILMGKNSMSFLAKLQANENHSKRLFSLSNFKKLTFLKLFSLNFSGKSPWCSSFPLNFESYNTQHWKKNCRQLIFWYHIIFKRLHCYEVTLVKKCNKQLLQKIERKIFDQKRFIKTCPKSTRNISRAF